MRRLYGAEMARSFIRFALRHGEMPGHQRYGDGAKAFRSGWRRAARAMGVLGEDGRVRGNARRVFAEEYRRRQSGA